jgi:hypothetical protein
LSKPTVARNTPAKAVFRIVKSTQEIHGKTVEGRQPSTSFPLRSLSHVRSCLTPKLKQPEKSLP